MDRPMTVAKLFYLICNAVNKDGTYCDAITQPEISQREATRVAKRQGWRRLAGFDMCPTHAKQLGVS